MPGGDGTGPMGMGPMTGRAAGYCAGYPAPGYMNPAGRGWGRGHGWRHGYWATGLPGWARAGYGIEITPKQEADILKNEAKALKEQLEDIQSRIETLEKVQTRKSKNE